MRKKGEIATGQTKACPRCGRVGVVFQNKTDGPRYWVIEWDGPPRRNWYLSPDERVELGPDRDEFYTKDKLLDFLNSSTGGCGYDSLKSVGQP
jgi:hypothetical protein